MRALLVLGLSFACHSNDVTSDDITKPTKPTKPTSVRPSIDAGWIDRCLGAPSRMSLDPTHLVAAAPAARAALDGGADVPRVEVTSYAPARQAEVAWTVASAALGAKRDAGALVDRAFTEADKVSEPYKRDRVLAWGAIELRRAGDTDRATTWVAAIKDADYKPELAAAEVARFAAAGDGEAARKAFAALPPMWSLRSDVEFWPGYPRWIGSAAAAACVALASPAFATSPAARQLVEDADQRTAKVSEAWRQNREYRALALAWARVGDLDRAMVATSRMPGSERSDAIVAILDDFGDAPGVDLARVGALARKAIAASRTAPLVLGANPQNEMDTFVGQAVTADVVAALVRRHLVRGDRRTAKAAADSIPTNLSKHYEAALQVDCQARLDTRDYAANLAAAAAQVKCFDVMQRILQTETYGDRIAENIAWSTIATNHLDTALPMLRTITQLAPDRAAPLHGDLAFALARAGRGTDAVAVINAIPTQPYKNHEAAVLASGYRSIVVLVTLGDVTSAKALDALLAPRLAHIDAMAE
jgi:hypothetical protein